jgi:hypothetical protein
MEMILKYHTLPWNWKYVSKNPNLTKSIVLKYKNIKDFDFSEMGLNLFLKDEKCIRYKKHIEYIKKKNEILFESLNKITSVLLRVVSVYI